MIEENNIPSNAQTAAERAILLVLPGHISQLERLRVLTTASRLPTVTVVGKYNHGKSRLLNELIGQDQYSVADKRETTALLRQEYDAVYWLDAPGLDADINLQDDCLALRAVWIESDIRLFIHTAKVGELDGCELAILKQLCNDQALTQRQNLFVLSQIDQLPGTTELENILGALSRQAPGTTFHAVSSTRHRQGQTESKNILVQKSGIPALKELISNALALVPQARDFETAQLLSHFKAELQQQRTLRQSQLEALLQARFAQRHQFDAGLRVVLNKVQAALLGVIDAPSFGNALTPDSVSEQYKLTSAKRERARIQVAYSRACVEIDAFLAGHGVTGLSNDKSAVCGSLYTVMIAVLGVSVKHAGDLQRIFGTVAGTQQLHEAFTRHFESSTDQLILARHIADAEHQVGIVLDAIAALATFTLPV
tara:strand:- start:16435 stop:17712 length:1278 start_codon:yes stop_codon:yes gene_type:complete